MSLMSLMSWIPNVLLKKSKSKKILYGLESNSQNLDFDWFLKKKSLQLERGLTEKNQEEKILYNMTLSLQNFLLEFHCLKRLFIFSHFRNFWSVFQKKSRKMSFYEGIDSRFEQMKKSKNKIELFLISSRSGRTDISKYSVLGSFYKDK